MRPRDRKKEQFELEVEEAGFVETYMDISDLPEAEAPLGLPTEPAPILKAEELGEFDV